MFLLLASGGTVLKCVRRTVEFGGDVPWTSKWVGEFVNLPSIGIGADGLTNKDDVANRVEFWVQLL